VTIEIDGCKYYKTSEACKQAGISRATLFRWMKTGILDKYYTDRRGWRLFTEEDLKKIKSEATKIRVNDSYCGGKNDGDARV
jgi:predicted site-specific integrase-resolvase